VQVLGSLLLQALHSESDILQHTLLILSTKPPLLHEVQTSADEQSSQFVMPVLQHRFPALLGLFPAEHAEHLALSTLQSVQSTTSILQHLLDLKYLADVHPVQTLGADEAQSLHPISWEVQQVSFARLTNFPASHVLHLVTSISQSVQPPIALQHLFLSGLNVNPVAQLEHSEGASEKHELQLGTSVNNVDEQQTNLSELGV
jgi:hypothetical protein